MVALLENLMEPKLNFVLSLKRAILSTNTVLNVLSELPHQKPEMKKYTALVILIDHPITDHLMHK